MDELSHERAELTDTAHVSLPSSSLQFSPSNRTSQQDSTPQPHEECDNLELNDQTTHR